MIRNLWAMRQGFYKSEIYIYIYFQKDLHILFMYIFAIKSKCNPIINNYNNLEITSKWVIVKVWPCKMMPTNSIEKLIWGKKLQYFFFNNNLLNNRLGFKKFGKVRMSIKRAQIYFTKTQFGFVQFVDYFIF